tara:strand:- start:436 stop:669 length:234 start_codon:yes stop_codon:yes gene_type:complete
MQNFTNYNEAKSYFTTLSNSNIERESKEGVETLYFYEDIKKQAGEFTAAKFLVDLYNLFMEEVNKPEEMKENINETR